MAKEVFSFVYIALNIDSQNPLTSACSRTVPLAAREKRPLMRSVRPYCLSMFDEELKIVEPSVFWRDAFIDLVNEFDASGESCDADESAKVRSGFSGFVQRLNNYSKGEALPEGWVPATTYWLVHGRRIVGICNLRHRLTELLKDFGGHIGYKVRPLERNKGYATLMLKLVLKKAHKYGIQRALVTCDENNTASIRVIDKNGGTLESESYSTQADRITRRYWIDVLN